MSGLRGKTKCYCVLFRRHFCHDSEINKRDAEKHRMKKKEEWEHIHWDQAVKSQCKDVAQSFTLKKDGTKSYIYFKSSCFIFAHRRRLEEQDSQELDRLEMQQLNEQHSIKLETP